MLARCSALLDRRSKVLAEVLALLLGKIREHLPSSESSSCDLRSSTPRAVAEHPKYPGMPPLLTPCSALLGATKPQVAPAQHPAQRLLNGCSEQGVSSNLSSPDLRLHILSSA